MKIRNRKKVGKKEFISDNSHFFSSDLGKNLFWNKNAQLYSLIPYEKLHSMQKNSPAMWNIFAF